jgi:hypothetical protein
MCVCLELFADVPHEQHCTIGRQENSITHIACGNHEAEAIIRLVVQLALAEELEVDELVIADELLQRAHGSFSLGLIGSSGWNRTNDFRLIKTILYH